MILLEIPTERLGWDDIRHPDQDTELVFDHLVRYVSHIEVLPAVQVDLEGSLPVVASGHKYLQAALALGRPTMRAIVRKADSRDLQRLLARPDVRQLDWAEIDRQERQHPLVDAWHVFVFASEPSAEAKRRFAVDVVGYFADTTVTTDSSGSQRIQVDFDDTIRLAEFRAPTRFGDQLWARNLLTVLRAFHSRVIRIETYQGQRFRG